MQISFREHSTWNVALNIECLSTLHPAPIVVLLITFSFVGATQVLFIVAHFITVMWPVWLPWCDHYAMSFEFQLSFTVWFVEDITELHKYHFVSSWGVPESHIYNHASAIDAVWCYGKMWKWEIMLIFSPSNFHLCKCVMLPWPNHDTAVYCCTLKSHSDVATLL